MNKSVILAVIIAFLVFMFAFQNMDAVAVKAAVWDMKIPTAFIVGAAFILGFLSVLMVSIPKNMSRRKALKDANSKVGLLENMLQEQMLKNKELLVAVEQKAVHEEVKEETPTNTLATNRSPEPPPPPTTDQASS